MVLENIVPWGRSLFEYKDMFSLSDSDLDKKILGCSDGPASFNAELTELGKKVVSVDPIYQFSAHQLQSRINDVYPIIMKSMAENLGNYVWDSFKSVEELGASRMKSMDKFLADYDRGKASGRYINGALPSLPFANSQFELALCSHYLFLYSEHVDQEQHIASLFELCRIADEVRVYPLLSLDGNKSKHLEAVKSALIHHNIDVSLESVKYEFQKGATKMLVARSAAPLSL